MDNEFFKRGTFGNRVSGSDVFDIELSETEPEGPRITEVEEEGAGQPSEGKVSIVEPDGTIIKKKGNFDPSGRLVIGQKASTGPGGKYNGSKFEGGAFDSNENLIEGSRTEVTVDDREIREEGKFCVSGYLYRGKRTAVGSTGKITESFDFESPGDGVEDTSIDGAKITTEPNGTKTVENGKFDLPSGSLSEGERIKMKIDGLEIKENGKFVFNSPDGVSNLVEGTRTTTKPNGSKFVEKVGGPSFGARIKNNLKKTLASLRSFLDKAVQLMKKLVNIALYLRIRHTTEEYGLRVQTEEAHIRR